jgi:hypothetical protein
LSFISEPYGGGGRIFLPVMLVVFGLGTVVLLIAAISALTDDRPGRQLSPVKWSTVR